MTQVPVRYETEHRCARKNCGKVASAYLFEDNAGYRICGDCYAVLKAEGATVSLIPPQSDYQFHGHA